MTVLIDSGASFNFATKASVARNNALYASALEASKSNTNVSVRLATGSIVSTRKVTISLKVKFDDFDSAEPFIVLDMDDRYDLILGMPWLAKHKPWIDWRSRTIGASHNPLADRALVGHVPSSSRDGFVYEHRVQWQLRCCLLATTCCHEQRSSTANVCRDANFCGGRGSVQY
ncbi:unnamed protein product [Phytophthora fragariaefolia]|uniref:Unnamed protein product n=1 Tax=Phytophthora fragariaefolia TaxID=1490495 RepID=A0A9W6XQ73_9STRA|nr:unnamed protein product [Phytophthora fragariaefolia]